MNDPIKKSVTVPLSPAEAFVLFTADISTWWPGANHSVSGAPAKITFPTQKGDDIVEEANDGATYVWGRLIAYDPGKYAAFSWFPGKTEAEATVVQINFTQTEGGTICDLTHGGWDVLGPLADAVSTSYLHGWDMVLGSYCAAAKSPVYA